MPFFTSLWSLFMYITLLHYIYSIVELSGLLLVKFLTVVQWDYLFSYLWHLFWFLQLLDLMQWLEKNSSLVSFRMQRKEAWKTHRMLLAFASLALRKRAVLWRTNELFLLVQIPYTTSRRGNFDPYFFISMEEKSLSNSFS